MEGGRNSRQQWLVTSWDLGDSGARKQGCVQQERQEVHVAEHPIVPGTLTFISFLLSH